MRRVLIAIVCATCGSASAQQLGVAVGAGPPYDVVANCLMQHMTVHLSASPVVHPPPVNSAEVHLFLRGGEISLPVASFFVTQREGEATAVRFEERDDYRGRYTAVAKAAMESCVQ